MAMFRCGGGTPSDLECTLLWENTKKTAGTGGNSNKYYYNSFSPQTISLDLSKYDYVLIDCLAVDNSNSFTIGNRNYHGISICPKGVSTNIGAVAGAGGSAGSRSAEVSDTGVVFGSGYNVGTVDNTYGIPYRIYGVTKYKNPPF